VLAAVVPDVDKYLTAKNAARQSRNQERIEDGKALLAARQADVEQLTAFAA